MERTKYTPKRLLSLLLALIMLLGMFPTAALATDGDSTPAAQASGELGSQTNPIVISTNSQQQDGYYYAETSLAKDGDIIFLPAVTVASYNAAKNPPPTDRKSVGRERVSSVV